MTKNDEIQKKIVEFQVLEANLKILQDRTEKLNEKMEEFQSTRMAIEELKETKPNEALIPLGSGIFIEGSVEKSENLIVDIGSGVVLKKSREETTEIIENKIKELEKDIKNVTEQSMSIILRLEKIREEVEKTQK